MPNPILPDNSLAGLVPGEGPIEANGLSIESPSMNADRQRRSVLAALMARIARDPGAAPPEGTPIYAGSPGAAPGKGIMSILRGGKKEKLLSNVPTPSGASTKTSLANDATLLLNKLTGRAQIQNGPKIAELNESQRLSLILQKSLSGVPLTKDDEIFWAAMQAKKAAK